MDPEDPIEIRIREWCKRELAETMKIKPERIEPNTKFARLGMDSAMSILFLVSIEEWLGIELQAELVFQYQTLAELARYLARQPEVARALERPAT